MANVQLSDVYNPLTFAQFAQESQLELNRFISSGILVMNPLINALASTGGNIGELPNYTPIGTDEPNYSNDVVGTTSTPLNITTAKQTFRLASQNQSWSTMDISRDLALADPVAAITGRIGQYWANTNEQRLISSLVGVLAADEAASSEMVIDIATDAVLPVLAAETISGDVVIDTLQTMGDHSFNVTAIAVHSVVYSSLQKQDLIQFVRNSDNNIMFSTYLGKRVIVDDSLPAVAGSNRVTYTSVLMGDGAVAGGEGSVTNASEMFRKPDAGNGGGEESIYSRRADIIHPLGFTFTSASVAGQSATRAELQTAANWTRVWDRKNIPIAFLKTNA